jgi:hypothetical protein
MLLEQRFTLIKTGAVGYMNAWKDKYSRYLCGIRQNLRTGHFSGYVGLVCGHPLYAKNCCEPAFKNFQVFGGIKHAGIMEYEGKDRWWVGFDCGNYFGIELLQNRSAPSALPFDHVSAFHDTKYLARQLYDYAKERQGS